MDHLFTPDPEIIQNKIVSSRYDHEIDTTVIAMINQHADDNYFTTYVGNLYNDEYYMFMKYLNLFYQNTKIDRLLYDENINVDHSIVIQNWFKQMYHAYQYFRSQISPIYIIIKKKPNRRWRNMDPGVSVYPYSGARL